MLHYLETAPPAGAVRRSSALVSGETTPEATPISISNAIVDLTAAWSRARRRVLKRGQIEDVHDLRTATRRLRVAIEMARDHLGFDYGDPFEPWRKLRRRLSEVRDWDVANCVLSENHQPLSVLSQKRLNRLLRRITRLRLAGFERADSALRAGRTRRVIRDVRRLTRRIEPNPIDRAAAARGWWTAEAAELGSDPLWRLRLHSDGIIPPATIDAIHAVRCSARSLRYGMEWWASVGVSILPSTLEFTRAVQSNLGRFRDVSRALELVEAEEIAPIARWLREEKAKAIAEWNRIRLGYRCLDAAVED